MGFQGRLVQLFHLRVEAVVHKGTGIAVGEVLDIEVDELGPQAHHLVDALDEVVGHFVAEAQALAHVLVEGDGALAPPASLVLFELDLIVFLGVPAGGLAADLHRGVGGLYPIAQLPGQGAVLVAHLQKGVDLIAGHAHGRVIVGGVVVDLGPAVVGVLAVVAPAHGEVHGHHAAVVVNGVELRVVPQVDAVELGPRCLFLSTGAGTGRGRPGVGGAFRTAGIGQHGAARTEPGQRHTQPQHFAPGDQSIFIHLPSPLRRRVLHALPIRFPETGPAG